MTSDKAKVMGRGQVFIAGQWLTSEGGQRREAVSPTSGHAIGYFTEASEVDADLAVDMARAAFDRGPWPRLTPAERANAILRLVTAIERRRSAFVEMLTDEIGAPHEVSIALTDFGIDTLRDAASLHLRFDFEEPRSWGTGSGRLIREPVGVVAAITPWNGPLGTAAMKLGPALAAGCVVVLKPASEGALTSLLIADAAAEAELPSGVLSILPGGRDLGAYIVGHSGVDKISFTGSTVAGRTIMASAAERIARVTLELGGKSAAIIADDVDLDVVLPTIVDGCMTHSGQICAALSRVLVPADRADEVTTKLAEIISNLKVGDPVDPDTRIGPLVSEAQRLRVEGYIESGRAEGARLVVGGGRPEREGGWYVEPTLFADVTPEMRIAREEIFGPVLCVIPFDDEADAVRIANATTYGLSGAVFARDHALAERIARSVRTGQISVNSYSMCIGYEPFGGYKQSGIGRETGVEGLAEYLETKVVQGI